MVYRGGRKTDNLMGRLKKDDIEGQALVNKRKEIAKKLGISYGAYKCRLLRGWTDEEASICPKVESAVRFYKGQSARSYVLEHGGSLGLYTHYIKYLPLEEAIDRSINKKGLIKHYRDGISLRQWCIKNGKDYNHEYSKMRRKEHPKQGNKKYFRDGITLHQWCKIHNISYNSEYAKEVKNAKHRKNS